MKGFALTPPNTVDMMIDLLFRFRPPNSKSTVLDPGSGTGAFIEGVLRWCHARGNPLPQIFGVELDDRHIDTLRARFSQFSNVAIKHADFLDGSEDRYDYIVGNPPYVPITSLSEGEKAKYRLRYLSARGRFDLYLLFYEQAIRQLSPNGRLVFITPEKFMYVDTAAPLRQLMASRHVEEIRLIDEDTFAGLVTYPTITAINQSLPRETKVIKRDRTVVTVSLPVSQRSWQPIIEGESSRLSGPVLSDLCVRISCGVATGADTVFVKDPARLNAELRAFARPTISGRQLTSSTSDLIPQHCMLIPYDATGRLLHPHELGTLGDYLRKDTNFDRLLERTCVRHKPWYSFHETPDLQNILKPKIVWKDITSAPRFWIDRSGEIVPRHSVYYLVPKDVELLDALVDYLNSATALSWLARNCQRAAKGYLRLQSSVLKQLPVPRDVATPDKAEPSSPDTRQLLLVRERLLA